MGPMYSILNINSIFHKRLSIRILYLGLLMSFLQFGNSVYCQPHERDVIGKRYDAEINKYLLPPSDNSISIIYLEKPSFDPEYVIRVNTFKDSIILEVHSFKENYFSQLYGHIKKYSNAEFEPEVNHHGVIVSNRLMGKMHSMFSQTIHSKLDYIPRPEIPVDSTNYQVTSHVDGTDYLFRLLNDEDTEWEIHQPIRGSMAFKAAAICSEIAFTLKNNNFNELKVIEAIEASGF